MINDAALFEYQKLKFSMNKFQFSDTKSQEKKAVAYIVRGKSMDGRWQTRHEA